MAVQSGIPAFRGERQGDQELQTTFSYIGSSRSACILSETLSQVQGNRMVLVLQFP